MSRIILTFLSTLLYAENVLAQGASQDSKTLGDIIRVLWNTLLRPAIIFLFLAATIVFIYGLVEFIARADDEAGRAQGKRHIAWGVFGMFIMVATGAIMLLMQNFFASI